MKTADLELRAEEFLSLCSFSVDSSLDCDLRKVLAMTGPELNVGGECLYVSSSRRTGLTEGAPSGLRTDSVSAGWRHGQHGVTQTVPGDLILDRGHFT